MMAMGRISTFWAPGYCRLSTKAFKEHNILAATHLVMTLAVVILSVESNESLSPCFIVNDIFDQSLIDSTIYHQAKYVVVEPSSTNLEAEPPFSHSINSLSTSNLILNSQRMHCHTHDWYTGHNINS